MLAVFTVIAGLAGVAFTALVTAYLGRRSSSGNIETSQPKDLWDTLRGELSRLQTESTDLRGEIKENRAEMTALREDAAGLREDMADLRDQLVSCHEVNTELLKSVKDRL